MAEQEKEIIIVWHGYEYEYREKHPDWYWVLGIIAVASAVAAIIVGNYLFALLIIVAAFSLAVHAGKKPDLKEFKVDSRGIQVGNKLYRYDNIDSFWLDKETPQLFFEVRRPLVPLIIIPVGTVDHDELKQTLAAKVAEKEHAVPLSHRVLDYFGF